METKVLKTDKTYIVTIYHGENMFAFNATFDELKEIHNSLEQYIKMEEEDSKVGEMVWNPRSKRHELKK